MKRKKEKLDGLSPDDLRKIRTAIRQIWHRSYPRRIASKRSVGADGFSYCDQCSQMVPKVFVDHIIPVGDLLDGGIVRMFCPSTGLQNLCKRCHDQKTKSERQKKKAESLK